MDRATVRTKMQVEVNAWQTPNFVTLKTPPRPRQEGWKEAPSIPLSELDADALSLLCDEFRAEVFRKAGKRDPDEPPLFIGVK
jgi:hypothetical protein